MLKFIVSMSLLGLGALASQPAFAAEKPEISYLVGGTESEVSLAWLEQLMQRMRTLPEFQAQEARIREAQYLAKGADRAIYNPELGLSYQNAPEDDTYSLSLSQTIDWGDKRAAASALALTQLMLLESDIAIERSRLYAEVLQALVDQSLAQKKLMFVRAQQNYGEQQLQIARQRAEVGDLSQAELNLMELEQASAISELALAQKALLDADTRILARFGRAELPFGSFADRLELPATEAPVPALVSAGLQLELARLQVNQAKAQAAADPNLSLNAEREGSDNKLGIGISVPLQLRNDYSESIKAAMEAVTAASAQYQSVEMALKQQELQFNYSLPRLKQSWLDWQQQALVAGRQAAELLGQRWRSGDLSTSDYLTSRRQLASSFQAGLELEAALYQSWLEWMGASGQLPGALPKIAVSQENAQ
ncbi:TolC family protein [Shewanella carassii]|uniref:Transporter n=2 Tax=Bacteria TaxID=2 RepID=A0ABQ1SZF8_9GAMM|nr:TolC family protein [Shewanella carassii]BCV65075.1 transporter [Shewanella carassii]GGE70503.1 transporter [Shewanella carassii]